MTTQIIRQSRPRPGGDALASFEAMARDLASPWMRAFDSWRSGVEDIITRTARPDDHSGDCECEDKDKGCAQHDCHCSCCVADSDLVIEARMGEIRMIPIVIENRWRRERPIEVQLSDWSCGTSKAQIEGKILEPLQFTIEPCGEHALTLALRIGGQVQGKDTTKDPNRDTNKETSRATVKDIENPRIAGSLDGCAVCYADLRIKGCDARSIRIAVAVLPNDCGAYRVDCCQACC